MLGLTRRDAAVAAASVCVNLAVIAVLGIRRSGDAVRYIDGATRLLESLPFRDKQGSYAGYVVMVAAAQLLGSVDWVIVFHLTLSAAAAVAMYRLGHGLAGERGAWLAAGALVLNPDIARWNAYVLTDAVYIALVVLVVAALNRGWRHTTSRSWMPALLLALVAATVRPNGWLLVPIVVAAWFLRRFPDLRTRILSAAALGAVFVSAMWALPPFQRAIEQESPGRWLREGVVVWGYDGCRLRMPPDTAHASATDWRTSMAYALSHPSASARLALTRVGAELAHVRPFYSRRHNVAVAIFLVMLYPLALAGLWRWRRTPQVAFATTIIVGHLGVIALTFADWDGRFLLYFLPLLSLFAACEIAHRLPARPGPR